MVKRAIAIALVVVLASVSGSAPPAEANPYTDRLCLNNPAYRSLHENECELGGGKKGDQQQGGGGLLGSLLRGLGLGGLL